MIVPGTVGLMREPGYDRCGIHEPALGQTDSPLNIHVIVSTVMTVGTGSTRRHACIVSTGFNRDGVGTDSTHPERRGDSCNDIGGIPGAVEQQDVDGLRGSFGIAVDPAGSGPECFMGVVERPGLAGPGQRWNREGAGLVLRTSR